MNMKHGKKINFTMNKDIYEPPENGHASQNRTLFQPFRVRIILKLYYKWT